MRAAAGWLGSIFCAAMLGAPAHIHAAAVSAPIYRTVTAPDGVPLVVMEWGNPDGPAVLLLHGFSLSSAVWRHQQQDAALAARYRFVALDLRGHGASGKPSRPQDYVDTKIWADDIAAVIEATKLVKPVVVAWSFGGNVVMNYVRHYGDANLSGINFIGSTGGLAERLHPLAGDAAYVEGDRQRRSEALADNIPGQRAFVRLMTVTPLSAQDEELWLVSTLQLPRYARAAMVGMRLDNLDMLDRVTVPTLFTTGAADTSVPRSQLEPIAGRLPRSTVSVYDGAGHSSFAEKPERFNRELMSFVESTRTAPQGASKLERKALDLVRSYVDAHNRHDVAAALAHYAPDASFVLSEQRGVARGRVAIGELEQLDAALGSWVMPVDLRARAGADGVIVSFSHVLEQSSIAEAIGVPLIIAEAVDEGFIVRRDRLLRVAQPSFAAPCGRAMLSGFRGFSAWLRDREDPRRERLLRPDGSFVLTAETAPLWITGIREWRQSTGWAPDAEQVSTCARS